MRSEIFERTQLLVNQGPGVAAMAVDASASIQSRNSLEKMMAHQLQQCIE